MDESGTFSQKGAVPLRPQPAVPSLDKGRAQRGAGQQGDWERGPGWLVGLHGALPGPWGPLGSFAWKDVI